MTLEPGEPEAPEPDPVVALPPPPGQGPSREYRATVAFTIGGAAILVLVVLLSGSLLQTSPPIRGVVALAGVLLGLVAMLGTAYGLSNGHRWAVAVATPMLLLLVIAGTLETVVALTRSTINFPIGALLAVWALRAPIRTAIGPPRWGAAGVIAFGALLVSAGWPFVGPLFLQAGGPLIVDAGSLQPSLKLDCPGTPAGPPKSVSITYDWRWSRAEPWVAGNDSVTLAAYTTRGPDTGSFTIDTDAHGSVGTWQSDVFILEPQGIVFGIDLAQAGFESGTVGFGLIAPGGAHDSPHGSIQLQATYLHAPRDTNGPDSPAAWHVITEGRCEW